MISHKANLLIIDDDVLHLEILVKKLNKLGYENITKASSSQQASEVLNGLFPDLIFLDYLLDGKSTAKQFIKENLAHKNIPIVIVSTFYGNEYFEEVKSLGVLDFLPKNISDFDLTKSIELALNNHQRQVLSLQIKDYIFVKSNKEIKKVKLADIYYITVDNKYLEIHTLDKRFLIRSSLSEFERRLPENFIKIHKAYIINIEHMDSMLVEEGIVKLGDKSVPLSRNFKKELLSMHYFS